jgi:hypothetical protein
MYRVARGILERLEEIRPDPHRGNPGTEPRNRTENIFRRWRGNAHPARDGREPHGLRSPPAGASRSRAGHEPNRADRILRDERQRVADRATVPEAAARILALSLELAALERETGPRDLDRLHKLAQTLTSIERLRPETGKAEEASLLSLKEDETQG